jgi:hypothetical protein
LKISKSLGIEHHKQIQGCESKIWVFKITSFLYQSQYLIKLRIIPVFFLQCGNIEVVRSIKYCSLCIYVT